MRLFVDESGTITKNKNSINRYFVIAFLETEEPYNVIRQFRRAKKSFIKKNPDCKFDVTKEIKGSEMPFEMKRLIFTMLSKKSDAKFHFKIVDNHQLVNHLLNNPSLSFNYFIYLTVNEISKISIEPVNNYLKMQLDDRNTAIESLNSLQEYLTIKFTMEHPIFSSVETSYKDSRNKDLIQVVDLFANTVFRVCRNHASKGNLDRKNRMLLSLCNVGCDHYFPKHVCDLDICYK
ncbi:MULTISPECIES: DUF3800 domain-containing protein [Listeria]|uniref:DUF3800 domain-containing protein n=1 Tax=Listeria TaxID=1637 RepID=UPI000BDE6119|nr:MULTISPECIES: DUF3800 domain-containing protein [Listeria]EAG9560051.1 DUF3800 domain-containing protein [Listeria monocytogenes]EAH1453047.1 DUF3800 domain-containing protein [Listeria monocytogenes]EAH1526561.1 DUF3800 domain-containing protein [Listeria monocytogenes]EAH1863699.1 DUF3800 domain-containing protein [Listeria monocytogenes]EAH1867424.1 DUF3800 domain-containing protein [Listeria monocytogenes]